MVRHARKVLASLCLCLAGLTGQARADSELVFISYDADGEGILDPTPAVAIGGNGATTLGEQRSEALLHAASVWEQALDSEVPIRVALRFEPLECDAGSATLGQATTSWLYANFQGAPEPDVWYPSALADRLARVDQDPSVEDIVMSLNSRIDDPDCLAAGKWYYGLDAQHGDDFDLVTVVLHELAHGLGMASFTNLETGRFPQAEGHPTVYATRTFDLTRGLYWHEMSDGGRAQSAINVRQVIWDGQGVRSAAPGMLDTGAPLVETTPVIAGFSGAVGTAVFGPPLATQAVTASVQLGEDGVDAVHDGCQPLADLQGRIALLDRGTCLFVEKVAHAQAAGAVAVLIADHEPGGPPTPLGASGDTSQLSIPSVRITLEDGDLLRAAMGQATVTAALGLRGDLAVGTDPSGGVFLYAADPLVQGSSISHWDPILTPNLLMEPAVSGDLDHGLDLTLPLMRDIGWAPFECGNGVLEPGEICEEGEANSDSEPDACRRDCRLAHCGDGVMDSGEGCDDGNGRSGDGCSAACAPERCGDGVVNGDGEECDDAGANHDGLADACRTDCRRPRCGDGVTDSGELCDDGPDNDDGLPNACRSDCAPARCGDAVTDAGEGCDDGDLRGGDGCDAECQQEARPEPMPTPMTKPEPEPAPQPEPPPPPPEPEPEPEPDPDPSRGSGGAARDDAGAPAMASMEQDGCGCRLQARSAAPGGTLWGCAGLVLLRAVRRRRYTARPGQQTEARR